MTIEIYLAYITTVLIFFAHPPGPSQLLFIANSMRHGVRGAMPTLVGDLSANTLQILIAGFGLVGLIHLSASFFIAIKWMGVAYLVYLGARIMLSSNKGRSIGPPRRGALFRQGFVTSAANPYAVVFFAALFPQFIDPARPLAFQIAVLGATYLAIDGAILVAMGSAADRLVAAMGGRFERWSARVSGFFLIVAAVLLSLKDLQPAEGLSSK